MAIGDKVKALMEGSTTAADVGAAPAGFGLGTRANHILDFDSMDDKTTLTGFYTMGGSSAVNPPFGDTSFNYGPLSVQRRNERIHQVATRHDNLNAQRVGNSDTGEWQPWEWVNPPMKPGIEYRTTERYCGLPVYRTVMEITEMPAANTVVSKNIPVSFNTGTDIDIIGLEGGLLCANGKFVLLNGTDKMHWYDPFEHGWQAYATNSVVYIMSKVDLTTKLADGTPEYTKFEISVKYIRSTDRENA